LTVKRPTSFKPQPARVRKSIRRGPIRLTMASLGLLACLWAGWNSGRAGVAQMLASYGAATRQMDVAEMAVGFGPQIPEAHYVRAGLLFDQGRLAEAIQEYESAAALRPHDYTLWLQLGLARDQANDTEGAIAAFKESVRLAPFYAQPHWQLGNSLYRVGRIDEAFQELRRAAESNPKLLPQVLDLAWAAFAGDPQAIDRAIQPATDSAHLALARYFARRGKTFEAIAQFRAAGDVSKEERRAMLAELLAARRFVEAYEVWSSYHREEIEKSPRGESSFINGGFESVVSLNDPGFGWQLPLDFPAVEASQDTAAPRTGARSLRLVWNGNAAALSPIISQLVLVEPNTHYQLYFAARTEKIVTAGRPEIAVVDASSGDGRTLGDGLPLSQGTSQWQDYILEFKTTDETRAVQISIRRQSCSVSPCPIFGRAWLDDFSIRKT
jgi:hypothetical protein